MFHFGNIDEGYFTGKFELTFTSYNSTDTWECHDGLYTRDAAESTANVAYTDIAIAYGEELRDIGFSESYDLQ